MATYKSRLMAPSSTDKNWLHTSAGGYNSCIKIKNGSVLPNCVGYAWGRWRELLGANPKLSRSNAENWWGKADGYERGQTPKLGAVICWAKGKVGVGSDGAGHVAIVEQIKADGSIITSNSGYGGSRFYKKTLKPPYALKGYTLQGFIYLPMVFDNEIKEVWATEGAKSFLRTLAGTYKVTAKAGLNVRYGAGVTKKKMVAIKKGTEVECHGYYTRVLGVNWLYIKFDYNGKTYVGFASSEYLKK